MHTREGYTAERTSTHESALVRAEGKMWVWPALVTHVGTAVCVRGICLNRFCASAALQVFFCGGKELLVPQLFCLCIQARLGVNIGVPYVPRA